MLGLGLRNHGLRYHGGRPARKAVEFLPCNTKALTPKTGGARTTTTSQEARSILVTYEICNIYCPHDAILRERTDRARVDGRATARHLHGIIERAVRCDTVKVSAESAGAVAR